jgi:hypothetical protein
MGHRQYGLTAVDRVNVSESKLLLLISHFLLAPMQSY